MFSYENIFRVILVSLLFQFSVKEIDLKMQSFFYWVDVFIVY